MCGEFAVTRPMVFFAASVLVTVLAWRVGAPWLVGSLCLACQAVLLARRVVLWPLVAAALGGLLAWGACLGVPPWPDPQPGRGEVVLRVDRFPDPPGEGRRALEGRVVVPGALAALSGRRVRVDVPGWSGPFRVGDLLRVDASWRPVTTELFLARGLRYRASSSRPPLVVGAATGAWSSVERTLQATRDALVAGVARAAGDGAPLVASLVLGVRGDVSRDDLDVLADTGVIHLFAISGGQLALFGGLLFLFVRALASLWRPLRLRLLDRKLGAVLALLAALGFALLSGSNVSTLRSLWMMALYFGSVMVDREADGVTFLAVALSVLVLWSPTSLFDPSLQLSAVGVVALFVAGRSPARGLAAKAFVASWWAFVLTAPIGFAWFDRAALATPLANVVVVPLFSALVMPLAFAVVFVAPLWPAAAALLAWPLTGVLDATFAGLRVLAAWVPAPDTGLGFAASFVPLALVGSWALLTWEQRQRRRRALLEGLTAPSPA